MTEAQLHALADENEQLRADRDRWKKLAESAPTSRWRWVRIGLAAIALIAVFVGAVDFVVGRALSEIKDVQAFDVDRAERADCVRELELAYDRALGDGLIVFIVDAGEEAELLAVERYRAASDTLRPRELERACPIPDPPDG